MKLYCETFENKDVTLFNRMFDIVLNLNMLKSDKNAFVDGGFIQENALLPLNPLDDVNVFGAPESRNSMQGFLFNCSSNS